MGLTVYDERIPYASYLQLVPADTTTWKVLHGTLPSSLRADMIKVRSGSATEAIVHLAIYTSGSYAELGSVPIPAVAGHGGDPGVNLLASVLDTPLDGLAVAAGIQLAVSVETTLDTGEFLDFTLVGGLV